MLNEIKDFYDYNKKTFLIAAGSLIILLIVYFLGYYEGSKNTKTVYKDSDPIIKTEVQTETQTVVKYVPKIIDKTTGKTEQTDVEANVGKTDLHVKVNGHEQVINKSDSEKYVFDQNKLQLDQTSKATLDIKIPTIDNTRRWAVGIGYGNHGMAGKLDFPIGKTNKLGGWVAGDKKTVMAGIQVNF
jgi:hypothetical protein